MSLHTPHNKPITRKFTNKTYEKSFFLKFSPAHVYYANDNSCCIILKLIDCTFENSNNKILYIFAIKL